MGLFIPNKRAQHRRFSYEPRFYNPEKDDRIKRRLRVKSHVGRRKPAGLVYFMLLAALVIYMYLHLS